MITVKFNNLKKAIDKLTHYIKTFEDRQEEYLERLGQIGIDTATVRFRTAQYDGVNDVKVWDSPIWVDDNKIAILATGQTVAFIEFGTGVFYPEQHPKAEEVGAVRGSYGQGKGRQTSWGYYGEPGTHGRFYANRPKGKLIITHGNPPARALYDAGKEMRQKALEIAREVFGQ